MKTLFELKVLRKYRKMISCDETLSKEEREKILDAVNKFCDVEFKNQFKARLKIREILPLITNGKHIQARAGFIGIVKRTNDYYRLMKIHRGIA